MADSLRRIVDMASFSVLQDKLDGWLEEYHLNTCNQNVDRCLEIIELNSRIQAQLLRILHLSAAEGGVYGGSASIRARLLPWLSRGVMTPSASIDATIEALSDVAAKEREILDLKDIYERSIEDLEADLHSIKDEADQLKIELTEKDIELETVKRNSTSDKMFAETGQQQLRNRVLALEEELAMLRTRSHLVDSYEREIRRLRDELIRLNAEPNSALLNGNVDGLRSLPSSVNAAKRSLSPTPRGLYDDYGVGTDTEGESESKGIVQKYRQQRLVDSFTDLFIRDRLDAIDILRQFSDDEENNRRLIFRTVQESFMVARLAFINFKMRIRSTLASVHTGPGTLEEAVQDYINRNPDLYNITEMVSDVVRSLDRRSGLPDGVSCVVLQSFIRECCRLAWSLAALPRPLETSPASDYELYDSSKYRRSFDSDVTVSLVLFHVWPCLMQGSRIIVKGEACTAKPGTLVRSSSRGRSLSRSISPTYRERSRSASPRRLRTDRSSSPVRA